MEEGRAPWNKEVERRERGRDCKKGYELMKARDRENKEKDGKRERERKKDRERGRERRGRGRESGDE